MSGHQTTRWRYAHVPALAYKRRRIDDVCREFALRSGRFAGARRLSVQRSQECVSRSTLDCHDGKVLLPGMVRDLKLKSHTGPATNRQLAAHVPPCRGQFALGNQLATERNVRHTGERRADRRKHAIYATPRRSPTAEPTSQSPLLCRQC